MTRRQLEHVIRAAGAIAEVDSLIVVGSQAILGAYPDAPEELRASMEVDLYPAERPDLADVIDGAIGEESLFHEQFGYYAHGVGPETATLPPDWRERAVTIANANTRNVKAVCLHPVDLAISKLIAGRTKDLQFVKSLLKIGMVSRERLLEVAQTMGVEQAAIVGERLPR